MARTDARGGPQTRARIREVANRLFQDRGFDAVTVAEIAREAGVSSVTVFNHFPTKEDLFLDRADDAAEALRAAIVDRSEGDAIAALREMMLRLVDAREPLSGVDPRSMPFYRTVAGSPALIARARQIAWELQQGLASTLRSDAAFAGDPDLLAAAFIAGYGTVMVATAARMLAGETADSVVADHRARFETLFESLRNGFAERHDPVLP